jgi:DNA-binding NtrC family response regulator
MTRILLHSYDTKLHSLLASALKPECVIALEANRDRLKESISQEGADVLVLDFDLSSSSLEQQICLFEEISTCPLPIVVMTNDLRRSTAIEFMQRGAVDCVRKPPSLVEFKVIVGRAHDHSLMKAELDKMREGLAAGSCDRLIGSSGRAQVVYDLIRRVARLNAYVLVTGESGTGKELVARAIHNMGRRSEEPFVAVSCGAIPESLIEAELFGHERGAFTGSTGTRIGYLEQAGGGTLFLDEIGELSPNTQVKLLRVLQERQFSRLGSNKPIALQARVVFATHRNLADMVEAGAFRRDLFFRVNVMNIHVPPLRDRTEDIPLLAMHFLQRYAAEYEKPVEDIRPNTMELLVEYSWPGNIRELENVIQSAVILTDGKSIAKADLPEHIQELEQDGANLEAGPDTFEGLLRKYRINLVNQAITDCRGNKTMAARKLRVSRAYLHRLIRPVDGADEEEAAS